MQKSPTYSQNLDKLIIHADYIEQLESLPFVLEIDLEELPDDPAFESPKYKEEDFINVKQMMALGAKK